MRRPHGEAGTSLAEVMVAMSLSLVLGALLLSTLTSGQRLFRATEEESLGQTDIRTTIERLGRDIRNARALDAGASASQLVLWIDSNSDYKKQATEVVTWSLVAGADDHFDVARSAAGTTTRTARFVISQLAFSYRSSSAGAPLTMPLTQAQADSVKLVSSDILYAVDAADALAGRHTVFTERMRNVS